MGKIYVTEKDGYAGMQLKDLAFLDGHHFELVTDSLETKIEHAPSSPLNEHQKTMLHFMLLALQRVQAYGQELKYRQ